MAGFIDDIYLISVLHQFTSMKMFVFFRAQSGLELVNSMAAGLLNIRFRSNLKVITVFFMLTCSLLTQIGKI